MTRRSPSRSSANTSLSASSDLLRAEISEKQARSIGYQLTAAKLPLAKDLDDFTFKDTPINEALVRDLAGGGFIRQQRNAVFVGGTGTGKTHLVIAIARSCIRAGVRGRFFTTVDLVNRLEAEARGGRQGRIADYLTRMDFVVLDELGYLPFCWNASSTPSPAATCRHSGRVAPVSRPKRMRRHPEIPIALDSQPPARLTATSCPGAFWTPAVRAHGKIAAARVQEPAQ